MEGGKITQDRQAAERIELAATLGLLARMSYVPGALISFTVDD